MAKQDRKFRVGVIGHTGRGNYGHGLDTTWLRSPRAEIVAVADAHAGGLKQAGQRLRTDRTYADYRQMLEKEKPDIVAICQRWVDQHRDMALACFEHGCHVYMEKPFCRDLTEADQIVQASEMRHLKVSIAHITRFSPHARLARQLIRRGEIGDVLEIRGRGKEDRRGGGEDLWVLGSHILDLMRYLVGDPLSCNAFVEQAGELVRREHVAEGNEGIGPLAGDHVEAQYRFAHGVTGHFASHRNRAARPSRFGLTVWGTKGAIEVLTGHQNTLPILKNATWSPARADGEWSALAVESEPGGSSADRNLDAIDDLMTAIEQDRQPQSSVYDARASVEMIAAVFESHRQQRSVTFPLKERGNPLSKLD